MNPAFRNSTSPRQRATGPAVAKPALCALALCALLEPTAAFAYLDPSTGSMVVSAIVGIFASIALAVKTYWYKIKAFFRRGSSGEASRETQQEPNSRESGD